MASVAPRSGTGAGSAGVPDCSSRSSAGAGIGAPSDVRCSSAMARHSAIPRRVPQGRRICFLRCAPRTRCDAPYGGRWTARGSRGFPGAEGRIPNFAGAKLAAQKLAAHRLWKRAQVIKANPDSPQTHARRLALEEGKQLVMAVPRLRDKHPFRLLDPKRLTKAQVREAATIKGALRHGRVVALEEMPEIDFVLCGSVAVNLSGARIGKGGGFSDLEYGLLIDAGKIDDHTVRRHHRAPDPDPSRAPDDHRTRPARRPDRDASRRDRGRAAYDRPRGILWDHLQPPQIHEIPILERTGYA